MWWVPLHCSQDGVNAMFQSGVFNATAPGALAKFATHGHFQGSLLLYFVVKFVTVVFSLTMPMPWCVLPTGLSVCDVFAETSLYNPA